MISFWVLASSFSVFGFQFPMRIVRRKLQEFVILSEAKDLLFVDCGADFVISRRGSHKELTRYFRSFDLGTLAVVWPRSVT